MGKPGGYEWRLGDYALFIITWEVAAVVQQGKT